MIRLSSEIRKSFLEFFEKEGHKVVPSSPLVPYDDPTLLFTNAGMVQFKKVFLGEEKRPYSRAVSVQKCLRVGGKHNDLENVGKTRRHHTFFEMLGNFSFGDYFKEEAIYFAWNYITKELDLSPKRLYVTVYKDDEEAFELWKKIASLKDERIYKLGEKDNFWMMGDIGPCGPCSEILFDQGEKLACGPNCGIGVCDCDRFLEIWNLVFMQYERLESGELVPLPKPNIDTGMGLERISAVCQGVYSNFDTDLFKGLIDFVCEKSNKVYGKEEEVDTAIRVIVDHSRAVGFLIAEGIFPSNEGRGYVLRRLIRRGVRFGRFLGFKEPFMFDVCLNMVSFMKEFYPELEEAKNIISEVVFKEEENFYRTLDKGLVLLESKIEQLNKENKNTIPGDFAFQLYDTYGFPIDIIKDVAQSKGLYVDEDGFNKNMQKQRERSKAFWNANLDKKLTKGLDVIKKLDIKTEFVGYETLEANSFVLSIIKENGDVVQKIDSKDEIFYFVSQKTPFYGESGGQVGDVGIFYSKKCKGEIIDTIKPSEDLILHKAKLIDGELKKDEEIVLKVDEEFRKATARNHTCTHILHAALRKILGPYVKQAGSLVAPDRLRFDFTHLKALTEDEIKRVEDEVNRVILEDLPVNTKILLYEDAIKEGAIGLFVEKYGEKVRVVEIPGVSKELCGGTHLARTGEAGAFFIVSESSVASGIRRIEAVTGWGALKRYRELNKVVSEAATLLKTRSSLIIKRIKELQEQIKVLVREKEELEKKKVLSLKDELLKDFEDIGGIRVIIKELDSGVDVKEMRRLMDFIRSSCPSNCVSLLISQKEKKVTMLLYVSKDLHNSFTAPSLIKEIAKEVKGGGGGREDFAQAGGSDPSGIPRAISKLKELIKSGS